MKKTLLLSLILFTFLSCKTTKEVISTQTKTPFVWENANVYFLVTDRFLDGNPTNNSIIKRDKPTAKLRGFEGGDIRGVIQKLDEGYFTNLGITAIWMTPVVEQIHGSVDEGTGNTYGFHGYWAKDWTALDPSYGTREDLAELVEKAHAKGIRIMLDAVINHTGHATEFDEKYPDDWVRSSPNCTYNSYQNNIECTLVTGLFDVKTESNQAVELPQLLVEKWKKEGRYEQEIAELDAFFARTGYPRAPKYYIMKWLADYILDFGIDAYRVDTVKHTTEDVWADFSKICKESFEMYKQKNTSKVLDTNTFYMIGELYGYGISGKKIYDFGDKKVNYFANGFDALINFDFKGDANSKPSELFKKYNEILQADLKGFSVMNYATSHDDGAPFDKKREKTYEAATKLLLTPGIAQVYYGDETARSLEIEGTTGDATLRSRMNWDDLQNNPETQNLLKHYQKLGQFRANHPAVGAGTHTQLSEKPYICSRVYTHDTYTDTIMIGLDLPIGLKEISVKDIFTENTIVTDYYSGKKATVTNGKITIDSSFGMVLLGVKR